MANTIKEKNLTIEISAIDEDWSYADDANDPGLHIESIQFNPAVANDRCVIKEDGDTGPSMFDVVCADIYDQKIKHFHGKKKHPVLDFSAGVYAAGTKVLIELSERR